MTLRWMPKHSNRGRVLREQHGRINLRNRLAGIKSFLSWPLLVTLLFAAVVSAINLIGETALDHVIGERIDQPIYAKVTFQVPDATQTAAEREAARAKVPNYYVPNDKALTVGRIRADLMRLYEIAAEDNTFQGFAKTAATHHWPADRDAYERLRKLIELPDGEGREHYQGWVDRLPLENLHVVRGLSREQRMPPSAVDFVWLEGKGADSELRAQQIPHSDLVQQANESSLQGSAMKVARELTVPELRPTIEEIVLAAFREQPTILYNKDRTQEEMKRAEDATPEVKVSYEQGKPFISPGILDAAQYDLLKAHHEAYLRFLNEGTALSAELRHERFLQQAGSVGMLALLCVGFTILISLFHPELFESRLRTANFFGFVAFTLAMVRILDINMPHIPELVFVPCTLAATVLAIAYPRRFALFAACMTVLLAAMIVEAKITFLAALAVAAVASVIQLDEIRSRTKVIKAGLITAGFVLIASAASGLLQKQSGAYLIEHTLAAGACVVMTFFILSGILPFIERVFRIATSLTLLEWRDPTKPLLQLLAREAPGTYNHSLVLGNLAESACAAIGANGLLAQVGALYHDIGKVHRAAYFTENQEGRISRHENLAPTMSLLIILGHVKDGLELARQNRLPRVLHQFIAEHHGTTVVRYFHRLASDQQPRVALGKHDREVAESDYRYSGPRPRSRESAVLMICDGVEGAVRALPEPTVGRIESTVHQIVSDRLNDGQFDECDITLREIRLVEESVVKSLCGIYHGRVAYPKEKKIEDQPAALKISV